MQYLLLIYADEKLAQSMPDDAKQEMFGEYKKFTQEIVESGHFVGGDALTGVDTATSVRIRNGEMLKTDGPFAETKEQLGGYYLVEVKDQEEACAIAARIPTAKGGTIEVRSIMHY